MKIIQSLVIFVIIMTFSVEGGFAATPPPDKARIVVVRGGNVIFNVNAMDKYSNGVSLDDWTVARISYIDDIDVQPSLSWSFTISLVQTEIKMDGGVYTIPLDYLDLYVSVDEGERKLFHLTDAPLKVLDNHDFGDYPGVSSHEITISYKLGVLPGKKLISCPAPGCPSGFYYIDLLFDLSVQ